MYEKDLNAAARPAQSRKTRRIISDENGEGCGGRKVVAAVDKLTSKVGFLNSKSDLQLRRLLLTERASVVCRGNGAGLTRNVVRASANTFFMQFNIKPR